MPAEVKDLLNQIINDAKTDDCCDAAPVAVKARVIHNNPTFYPKNFRDQLSFYVLKDIIAAMMADDVNDADGMVDASIMKHIKDNYNGSCYDYLSGACQRCKSPLLGSVIQEIDDVTDGAQKEVAKGNEVPIADAKTAKEILDNVENYAELRKKITDQVTQQVINDVAGVITSSQDAPTFDDLDEKIDATDKKEEEKKDAALAESTIMRMSSAIRTEYAINKQDITAEQSLELAITEYCIHKMDVLFKMRPRHSKYLEYAAR